MNRFLSACLVLAAVTAGGVRAADGEPTYDPLVKSGLVHCAFYRDYELDAATGDRVLVEGRSNSLTHFQGLHDDHARQISTRMAGSRRVRMIRTDRYLHFVDRIAGSMYLLTTVYGCLERDPHGICLKYGAMQSRHFDARALYDPDVVYEALRERSDPGFCDHSFIGIREAASRH